MLRQDLIEILRQVAQGGVKPEDAAERLTNLPFEDLGFARLDHHRQLRHGFPEVIFGQSKSPDQIVALARALNEQKTHALITRVGPDKAEQVQAALPQMVYHAQAQALVWAAGQVEPQGRGQVAVISAGTSDIPVAEEAKLTAELMGSEVETLYDVGVAGLHRILSAKDRFKTASALVVVAGMEGALPSVVAGLWGKPVVAVPTSVGYGAAFGGLSALLGMLTSCAPGVSVVNIDNGFGAGFLAGLIDRG
ncbi:MAG: nickel pincer cofactor biosynthesis protein LarB [Deltaproteobacteria bacterium]|nr:nickel pincer cofactor biosynthesis protein LarB [Deltaproteobacteria bacterium]